MATTAMALPQAACCAEFKWFRNAAGLARLACNLSGLGRVGWIDRLLGDEHPVARRIELVADDGVPLVVESAGAGRPLLLLHGLGGSHHDWDPTRCQLARSHRVVTFDLRGHGSHAGSDAQPTLERMARDVALVIERLGLERPVLIGHSMGALVAMQYLKIHGTQHLGGVCLIDQSPRITVDAGWRLGLFGSLTAAELRRQLLRLHRFARALGGALGVTSLLPLLESLAEADFRQVVAGLTLPTLVVLGGLSHHYGGLPLADYYRSNLARGTVTIYATSTHSPHEEEPLRFAAEVARFAATHCA